MNADERLILESIVRDATVDLFHSYDVPFAPTHVPYTARVPDVAGVIGFSGDELRGSVLIAAPEQTLLACSCLGGVKVCSLDWVGELANQLLGRIKSGLGRYSLSIQLATPVAVRGVDLQIQAGETQERWALSFETPYGLAFVHLAADVAPGIAFVEAGPDAVESAAEGELMFF
jgi:CheY-specific phosphatase CheX